ncbi:hypothetical protein [Pseudomonas sp. TCU-HL1]|uniref:hypothetical protein n=1 Tax=Pseudomonas sp. TCU-HL1 TaxID=1856685 RepID=UPI00083E5EA5|nr:hypothetical protein [Pseudomonas sp. TCU-HL1]AOE86118.1 hypothetical protein THL1_3570 [Pseudomonas sp. TCU-HL1]
MDLLRQGGVACFLALADRRNLVDPVEDVLAGGDVLDEGDDLKEARDERQDAGEKLAACRETRGNLLVQVGEQNQALAGMRQAALDRQAIAKKEQESARQQAEEDYQAANRLQQERFGGDACAAAEAVIDKELGL